VAISTHTSQNVRFAQQTSPTGVVPPRVLTHPSAAYSDEARRRWIEGTVIVQAQFDEAGNITVLKVVKGLGYGLDENALAVLKDWRFSPALRNGLPVSAIAEIEVPFKLARRQTPADDLERLLQNLQTVQTRCAGLVLSETVNASYKGDPVVASAHRTRPPRSLLAASHLQGTGRISHLVSAA
jgi:TonB family protein